MLPQEAQTLLHTKLAANWNAEDADQLLQTLDRIPLALAQAAAFISDNAPRFTLRRYIRELQELLRGGVANANLLYQGAGDLRRDPSAASSIGVIWQSTFDRIGEEAPSAARLLSLMSLFHSNRIQVYLLVQYDDDKAAGLDHRDKSKLHFKEDISVLRSYFLITMNEQGYLFIMHRLMQLSLTRWLERKGELKNWKGKFLMIMSKAFPEDPDKDWAKCRALFPHAVVAINYQPDDIEYGEYYATTGSYEMAENMSQSALSCCEASLGPQHSLTLSCAQNLASIVQHQGEYKSAEDMIRSVYEIREKSLGPTHPDTLSSAGILASVLRLQGRMSESQEFSERILEVCYRTLGPKHPDTLSIISNLAVIYYKRGRVEEALALQEVVLESRRRLLGEKHPDTLSAMADIAATLSAQGRSIEAESLQTHVIKKGTRRSSLP